ncbi:MAG: speA [Bacillales bacterium]|jgi:arginine/lysine/ornithine decarboxylase|nr:speA [Bacillales bacterium]
MMANNVLIKNRFEDLVIKNIKDRQDATPLYDAMKKHISNNVTAFDVPGHKRSENIELLEEFAGRELLKFDVNSMPNLDNLNYPKGVIAEAQDLMAEAFGADHAFFIVGGTTQAIHAMIFSACGPGEKLLLPRNVHKSAVNAMIMAGVTPVYMHAGVDDELQFVTGVSFETAKQAIDENPDAKAILLINPTYYGACSPLKEITDYAHSKDMVVLVDEAHGAHLHFHDKLPLSAMTCGADISATSIHKTGGSLTQSSALLLKNNRISKYSVQKALNLLQTTSASYLLMTSLDIARRNLALNGKKQLDEIIQLVSNARASINLIPGLYAYGLEKVGTNDIYSLDETKLGVQVSGLGITGFEVYEILRTEYNIQLELADTHNILAIISFGDKKENLAHLVDALRDLSQKIGENRVLNKFNVPNIDPVIKIAPREAFFADKETVLLEEAIGRISAESVMVYPPGIPILSPGELITTEIVGYIEFLKTQKSQLTDMSDKTVKTIQVIQEFEK